MIKSKDVNQALINFLDGVAPFTVYSWDEGHAPQANESYILEKCMLGNTNISLSPNDDENVNGIYQIDVYTPLASKNKWYGLAIRDDIKLAFTKGLTANISANGQKVIINNVNTPPMRINESGTHRIYTVDVNFRVIG